MQDRKDVREALQKYFGFDDYRQGQERVIQCLMQGQSALAVFPTGGGKSLCYQLPAVLFPHLTLVISPLIALMKDQIDFLLSKGIAAARLDSSLSGDEVREVWEQVAQQKLKLLYVAPERFGSERFVQRLRQIKLSLMVIDEAHCISEWGHNFRPDYLKLARMALDLNIHPVLGLTATATAHVAKDICVSFGVAPEAYINTGFHRPNLRYLTRPCQASERFELLLDYLNRPVAGSLLQAAASIIYVTRQQEAEDLAADLQSQGWPAVAYHAGLPSEQRHRIQENFMASDDGLIVATIAFGMGIDKANIRRVIHYHLPKSLENYAQETGRAGRDGLPSDVIMLACAEDLRTLENFVYGDTPDEASLNAFLEFLLKGSERGQSLELSTYHLSRTFDLRPAVLKTLLTYLELEEILRFDGPIYTTYKLRLLQSKEQILASVADRVFYQNLFAAVKPGRTWYTFELSELTETLDVQRSSLVSRLNNLEEQGLAELKVSGLNQVYTLINTPDSVSQLTADLNQRFQASESREIARLQQVLALAKQEGCVVHSVLSYFGASNLEAQGCGHCDRCLGLFQSSDLGASALDTEPVLGSRDKLTSLKNEGHRALSSDRQMARFLCGISSPATQRDRLTRHAQFAALAHLSFQQVLSLLIESA